MVYSKKTLRRCAYITIIACALFIICNMVIGAVELRSSLYFSNYSARLTTSSGGKVGVYVRVDARNPMTSIGASEIVIYEASDGASFSPVKTYYSSSNPSMLTSGMHYAQTAVTHPGIAGYTYYAIVTFYAKNTTGSDSYDYTTQQVIAK